MIDQSSYKPSFADRIAYIPKRGRLPLGGIVLSCVIAGVSLGFTWDIYTYYEYYKNPDVSKFREQSENV